MKRHLLESWAWPWPNFIPTRIAVIEEKVINKQILGDDGRWFDEDQKIRLGQSLIVHSCFNVILWCFEVRDPNSLKNKTYGIVIQWWDWCKVEGAWPIDHIWGGHANTWGIAPFLGSLTHWFAATCTMERIKPPFDYLRLDTSWGDACVHLDMLSLVFESRIWGGQQNSTCIGYHIPVDLKQH